MILFPYLANYNCVSIRELWKLEHHNVPTEPGVYLLLADPKKRFQYPDGESSVFYIGKANNLRSRLMDHLRWATEAKSNRRQDLYWPRYEYAAVFGCNYTFIKTQKGQSAKDLEDEIIARFALEYRSFPITNGAGAWRKLNRENFQISPGVSPNTRANNERNTYLFITNPTKYDVEAPQYDDNVWWSCSKTTLVGDRLLIYLTNNIGVKYEWRAVSDAEKNNEWGYACYVEYVDTFTPPISLSEIKKVIAREEWAPPYLNFRGFKSIQIPAQLVSQITSLRLNR